MQSIVPFRLIRNIGLRDDYDHVFVVLSVPIVLRSTFRSVPTFHGHSGPLLQGRSETVSEVNWNVHKTSKQSRGYYQLANTRSKVKEPQIYHNVIDIFGCDAIL